MTTISNPHFKRFIAAAAVALALPLAAPAFAAPPGAMGGGCGKGGSGEFFHPGMGGDGMPRYLHRLNLSEAQRDRVFDIMHAQAPVMRNAMKVYSHARSDLQTLATAADFDEAKAKAAADALAAASGEIALNRIKTERQVFDVLTPEQRQQVAAWKAERTRQPGDAPRRPAGPGACPAGGC